MSEAPTQEASLLVHEIYLSIQGESTYAGLPCIFIRLTGCDLRCSYCDTAYAFKGGKRVNVSLVLEEVNAQGITLVVVTHEPDIAARCNRTIRLVDGRIA